jgi:hypothetical protein
MTAFFPIVFALSLLVLLDYLPEFMALKLIGLALISVFDLSAQAFFLELLLFMLLLIGLTVLGGL